MLYCTFARALAYGHRRSKREEESDRSQDVAFVKFSCRDGNKEYCTDCTVVVPVPTGTIPVKSLRVAQ